MVVGAELRCFGVRLESGRFWTRHFAKSREASSYGEREPMSCAIKTKDLRRP
jgi:hypothetical protein